MAENSKIEWTTHTFNPWRGCTKISPGCTNCYAETLSHRNPKTLGVWGDKGTRVIAAESAWREPLKWGRKAKEAGERHRVFCASLADVFEDRPELQAPRERLFDLIVRTPNLDWLLLTKRPENITKLWPGTAPDYYPDGWPNVWLGVSVENQAAADDRIPHLLRSSAAVRFLSVEPLLGPVELTFVGCPRCGKSKNPWIPNYVICRNCGHEVRTKEPNELRCLDWVIVGGESGHDARPCSVDWVRSIVQQCKDAGVPSFVKQLGAVPFDGGCQDAGDWWPDQKRYRKDVVEGREVIVRLLNDKKGGDPAEWPESLRVREFPTVAG